MVSHLKLQIERINKFPRIIAKIKKRKYQKRTKKMIKSHKNILVFKKKMIIE